LFLVKREERLYANQNKNHKPQEYSRGRKSKKALLATIHQLLAF